MFVGEKVLGDKTKGQHACAIVEEGYWYLEPYWDHDRKKWEYKIIGPIQRDEW